MASYLISIPKKLPHLGYCPECGKQLLPVIEQQPKRYWAYSTYCTDKDSVRLYCDTYKCPECGYEELLKQPLIDTPYIDKEQMETINPFNDICLKIEYK